MSKPWTGTQISVSCGLTMITGASGCGKTRLVDSGALAFHKTKLNQHNNVNITYLKPFLEQMFSLFNEEVHESDLEFTNIGEFNKIIANMELPTITSYIFTEQFETEPEKNSVIVTTFIDPTTNKLSWAVEYGGKVITLPNIITMVLGLSLFGPVFVKSASPTFFTLPDLPNASLKRGLSALYLDSIAAINSQVTRFGTHVILEVRDDFDDEDDKLNGAPRSYFKLNSMKLESYRFRLHPYDDFSYDDFANSIDNLKEVLRVLLEESKLSASGNTKGGLVKLAGVDIARGEQQSMSSTRSNEVSARNESFNGQRSSANSSRVTSGDITGVVNLNS